MVGAPYLERNIRLLKPGGRLVYIAFLEGAVGEINLASVMMKRLTVTGSTLRARPAAEKARLARAVEAAVWPWIAAGKLRPVIDAGFPLAEAEAAMARMKSGAHTGKIVLLA
jgi:NADPH:quinone reductase